MTFRFVPHRLPCDTCAHGDIMFKMLRVIVVLLLALATAACSTTVMPLALRDAQLGARVKTALVNDPDLGTRPIEVRVTRGVVRLTGRVESDAHADRAISLARGVPEVGDVISDLQVGPVEAAPLPAADQQGVFDDEEREPQLLAVGISVGYSEPRHGALGGKPKIGPLVRIGRGGGLGPAIGFGWFHTAWRADSPGAPVMGRLRVRPVMGGLAYGFQGDRRSISFSLVGGVAFNSLSLPTVMAEREIPLSIDNSFAVRPGVSLWFDVDRRVAINLGGSYLMTRPRVRVLEDGRVGIRSLRADAVLINAGIVYKIF